MNSFFCGKIVRDLLIKSLLDEKEKGFKWQKKGDDKIGYFIKL